jgi:hypothetical protein
MERLAYDLSNFRSRYRLGESYYMSQNKALGRQTPRLAPTSRPPGAFCPKMTGQMEQLRLAMYLDTLI